MLVIFSFCVNTNTKEAAFSGNISPAQALQILQNIVIAEGVRQAGDADRKDKEGKSEKAKKKPA